MQRTKDLAKVRPDKRLLRHESDLSCGEVHHDESLVVEAVLSAAIDQTKTHLDRTIASPLSTSPMMFSTGTTTLSTKQALRYQHCPLIPDCERGKSSHR